VGDEFRACGQRFLYGEQFVFDALHDHAPVLADEQQGQDVDLFALAVLGECAVAHGRRLTHGSDLCERDRCPVARGKHNPSQVVQPGDLPDAAHHRLLTPTQNVRATRVLVAGP
jgi:hypothetical protein